MAACEILVEYNNRRQVVKFCHNEELSDVTTLSNEVVKVFKVEGTFVIQMKTEGEFVDVFDDELHVQVIPEHSMMQVVQVENTSCCTERGNIPFNENNEACTGMVYKYCSIIIYVL